MRIQMSSLDDLDSKHTHKQITRGELVDFGPFWPKF